MTAFCIDSSSIETALLKRMREEYIRKPSDAKGICWNTGDKCEVKGKHRGVVRGFDGKGGICVDITRRDEYLDELDEVVIWVSQEKVARIDDESASTDVPKPATPDETSAPDAACTSSMKSPAAAAYDMFGEMRSSMQEVQEKYSGMRERFSAPLDTEKKNAKEEAGETGDFAVGERVRVKGLGLEAKILGHACNGRLLRIEPSPSVDKFSCKSYVETRKHDIIAYTFSKESERRDICLFARTVAARNSMPIRDAQWM